MAQASSSGVNDAARSLLSPRRMGGLVLGVLWGLSQMRGLGGGGGGMGWRFGKSLYLPSTSNLRIGIRALAVNAASALH
ncbi:hypothetical protein VKT23_011933 [Stygiomarasmius scandens]|uniref:Uncharacterized protein n=1 Tax=Marasmiellus scandens TaxID=2682957 RepID=A0ABR1JCX1_9AGAR